METVQTTSISFTFQDYKAHNSFTDIEITGSSNLYLSGKINQQTLNINGYDIQGEKEDTTVTLLNKESNISKSFILTIYKNIKNYCICFLNQTYDNSIQFKYSVYSDCKEKIKKYNKDNNIIIFKHDNIEIPVTIEYNLSYISLFTFLNIDITKFEICNPSITFKIEKQYEMIQKELITLTDKKEFREIKINNYKFLIKILLDKNKKSLVIHKNEPEETYSKKIINQYTEKYKEQILAYYNNLESFIQKTILDLKFNQLEYLVDIFEMNIDNIIEHYTKIKNKFPLCGESLRLPLRILKLTENDLEIYKIHYIMLVISQIYLQFQKSNTTTASKKKIICYESKPLYQTSMSIIDGIMKEKISITEKIEKIDVNIVTLINVFSCSKSMGFYKPPQLLDLVELEHNKPDNIYVQAIRFLRNLIDNLTEESALTFCFMQLSSIISRDLNTENQDRDNTFEMTYIPLPKLKERLHKLIPTKLYRIYANTDYYAIFSSISEKVTINEMHTFNGIKPDAIQAIFDYDKDPEKCYVFPLICVLMHELFGHALVRNDEENYGKSSPIEFLKNGNIYYHKHDNKKIKEAGRIVSECIGKKIMQFLEHPKTDLNPYFDVKYFVGADFKMLEKEIEKNLNDSKIKITDFDDVESNTIDKIMEKFPEFIQLTSSIFVKKTSN